MKILIIEDEEILLNSLAEKFTNESFEVIKATDGEDGLKKALEIHPDLILLDILVPKIDGLTVFEKIRKDDWGAHAKVIILTNANDNEKISEAMKVGLDGLLTYLIKTDHTLESIVKEVKEQLLVS